MVKHFYTGNQYNNQGQIINKNIIQRIIFQLNSIEYFQLTWTGISKDPFLN